MPRWAPTPSAPGAGRKPSSRRIVERPPSEKEVLNFREELGKAVVAVLLDVLACRGALMVGRSRDGDALLFRAFLNGE